MVELVCAEFFFAMQPYKYTKTSATLENKITNIIKLGKIRFCRSNQILRYDQDIDNADWVNITFYYQKNDYHN